MILTRFSGIRTCTNSAIVVLLSIVLLPACITSNTVNGWVDKKYGDALTAPTRPNTDYITISTTLETADARNSTTEHKVGNVLPLIVYWQWKITNTCTLNPKLPFNNFTNTVISYAGIQGVHGKLNGRRIELVVNQIPNVFALDDKGHLIIIGLAHFGWDVISVIPATTDMVVSYKIMQENTEVKRGVITIPDLDKPIRLKMFNSVKRKTLKYMDQYNDNITAMSKNVVDRLIKEL